MKKAWEKLQKEQETQEGVGVALQQAFVDDEQADNQMQYLIDLLNKPTVRGDTNVSTEPKITE